MVTPNNILAELVDGGYILDNGGWRTNKPVYIANDLAVTSTLTVTGLVTLTAGFTSAANAILKSATAVPATAGAVAAGAPITLYSNGITIEVTSDAPTHSRAKGSICINTGGSSSSTRMYVNTDGGTTWTSFTTAA